MFYTLLGFGSKRDVPVGFRQFNILCKVQCNDITLK